MPVPQQRRRKRVAANAPASVPSSVLSSDWERWVAQFRPEAQALWNLMIEINCRLAREAYARELASRSAARATA